MRGRPRSARPAARVARPRRSRPTHPTALDDPDVRGHFITFWAAGIAWALDWWERRTGRPIGPDDVEPLHVGAGRAGPAHTARRTGSRPRAGSQPRRRPRAAGGTSGFDLLLTPTLAEPPPPLGYVRRPPDNPLARLFRAAPLACLHAAVQHDRPARRSRCRCTGPTTACRSACSSSPRTAARICCCGSRRSSRRPARGPTAGPRGVAGHATA